MAKKFTAEIVIEKFIFPNIGVGFVGGQPVEIKNALPGQKVLAQVVKKRRKLEGRIIEILEKSSREIQPLCPESGVCGGCTFQSLPYTDEIEIKKNMVIKLIEEAGIVLNFAPEISAAPNTYHYRNKMEFSFGDAHKGGDLCLGMRKRGSYYEVADASACNICDEDFNTIVRFSRDFFIAARENFYHKVTHTGTLRHLTVRKGFNTGEILVNIVTTSVFDLDLASFVSGLLQLTLKGKITGILHTKNDSLADIVAADEIELLYGQYNFSDRLSGLTFTISPFSFFQTNTEGAQLLYNTVEEFAGDTAGKIVFDLYCGTGTIAQIVSKKATCVYGIEIVEHAVLAARENAKLNNIDNCTFIAGDVLKEVTKLTNRPDIIILDPPREGIHPKAIHPIIHFGADTIVYVSCKPTSLMKDLSCFLNAGYKVDKLKIHDMFPRSYHVETVVKLLREK